MVRDDILYVPNDVKSVSSQAGGGPDEACHYEDEGHPCAWAGAYEPAEDRGEGSAGRHGGLHELVGEGACDEYGDWLGGLGDEGPG